jgi:fatty-acid desaturase
LASLLVSWLYLHQVFIMFIYHITLGYHRLWAHRAYRARLPLRWFYSLAGAGAVEGSVYWWSRGHRAHHRYIIFL